MINRITPLANNRPVIDSTGKLTLQSVKFFNALANRLPIVGDGPPENVIEAQEGATYYDRQGITGSIQYAKLANDIAGDKTRGWVLV